MPQPNDVYLNDALTVEQACEAIEITTVSSTYQVVILNPVREGFASNHARQ